MATPPKSGALRSNWFPPKTQASQHLKRDIWHAGPSHIHITMLYNAIHIYIYTYILPLNLLEMHCVIQPHSCQRSQPQPIAESEFLMVFGSTRPGTVLRGDLQLLKIGPTNPSEGRRASGWVMSWEWSARGNLFQVAKKTKRKGYHQDHEVPIPNYLFLWEGTDYKGVRSKNPQSWNCLNWWNMVKCESFIVPFGSIWLFSFELDLGNYQIVWPEKRRDDTKAEDKTLLIYVA